MTRLQKWFVIFCFVFGLGLVPIIAQLQQSGGPGSSVSISSALPAGTNVIGKVGIDQTTPGTTNGVQVVAALPTGSNTIGAISNTTFGLNTGTNTIGKVGQVSTCGTTAFTQAWIAVPTSATSITATTTCVQAIIFTNTNASAQTVTVTDGQGSPVTVVSSFSIPGNSQVTFPFYGAPMTTGIKWSAGGTGVTGSAVGWQ